jgi:uncharacterized protein YndB with AHSA1/START domain
VAERGKQVFRIVIDGPQQAIFDELTRTDRPLPAIFNAQMHVTRLSAGGAMQMRTPSNRHVMVVGEVLEYDPPHRFAHTLRFAQYEDPFCRVSYRLAPASGGIEVTLMVDDLPLGTKTAKDMGQGGDAILRNLKAVVETGRAPLGWRLLFAVMRVMEFALPRRTGVEHWPLDEKSAKGDIR